MCVIMSMYVCMYVYVCMCLCMCMYVGMYVCVCMRVLFIIQMSINVCSIQSVLHSEVYGSVICLDVCVLWGIVVLFYCVLV